MSDLRNYTADEKYLKITSLIGKSDTGPEK